MDNKQIQSYLSKGDSAFKRGIYDVALDQYLEATAHVVNTNWRLVIHEKIYSIATADINNDGEDEILFGTENGILFAYISDESCKEPTLLWKFTTDAGRINGVIIRDINDDGKAEIVVAADKIYILDSDGIKKDVYDLNQPLTAVQAFENKNKELIVFGDNKGKIVCYNYSFQEVWAIPFEGANGAIIDLAIGDFDGDGKVEIAAASEDKYVYIIDEDGEQKDKINVNHWIVNMADCRMKNSTLRLFIGKFTGDTLVYKHKQTNKITSLKQSGILDLKVEYIFNEDDYPQFIVGSSDRCLSIFDYDGQLIWVLETGLGQRALSVKKTGDNQLDLLVGTESGDVFYYSLTLEKDLVAKIRDAYRRLDCDDLMDLNLSIEKLKILRNYVEYNAINKEASIDSANKYLENNDFIHAIKSAMDVWYNKCEFIWSFGTQGRIYDLETFVECEDRHKLLVGSDDGILYCLTQTGQCEWQFQSRKDLRGSKQGIRGVYYDEKTALIYTVSADKSLYCLNVDGQPNWNFCHDDWILYTCAGEFGNKKMIFAGTENGFILAFDIDGRLLWKIKTDYGKRVRAISFVYGLSGNAYLIAGCDDNKIYIIDSTGNIVNKFATPHYVLVVKACDVNADGEIEILTGNEDGALYAYNFDGMLLWRFETGSWVAALDILHDNRSGEVEIIIGSQDNNVYALNKHGALLWQYESNARVRTISVDNAQSSVSFGSYDKSVYLLRRINISEIEGYIEELFSQCDSSLENYQSSKNRHIRALGYLFENDVDQLVKGFADQADIVAAAIGCNLINNFLCQKDPAFADYLINLLKKPNRRVRSIVLSKLIDSVLQKKITKRIATKIFRETIRNSENSSSKIDIFRYWLAVTDDCDAVLSMAYEMLSGEDKVVDELLIDELNNACLISLKTIDDSCDIAINHIVPEIAQFIANKYPRTADLIIKQFN